MCGLVGICDTKKIRTSGAKIMDAIALQRDRGNGYGAGYAAYGIYPEFGDLYCFHLIYTSESASRDVESLLASRFSVIRAETIPTDPSVTVSTPPLLKRYFAEPKGDLAPEAQDEFVAQTVIDINLQINGASVASSGKNMGVFKGVGFPEEIGEYYKLDTYEGYLWTAHNRFPTNTSAWWPGAHPFALLDLSVVHNGELSSYGINSRYIEEFGYHCTFETDTEVATYLFDLLTRKRGMSLEEACHVLAPPLWSEIDAASTEVRDRLTKMRMKYASALLNGPFAMIIGSDKGMAAFNDRIKLRPLVAATSGSLVMVASEECSIHAICKSPDRLWTPRAGDPALALYEEVA